MSEHEVAAVRKLGDRFLRIALEIFVTVSAAPLFVFLLVGVAAETRLHGRRRSGLSFFRKGGVAARAVFFGLLDVLGM